MAADAIKLAKDGVDAFNRADWEKTRALTSPGVVYVETATGRRVQGIEAFIEVATAWRAAFPDAKGAVTSAIAAGDTAVIEITWTGTQTGALATPMGSSIPATGKKMDVTAVQIVHTSGGKITETRHYFDLMTMLTQLGVLPAPAHA